EEAVPRNLNLSYLTKRDRSYHHPQWRWQCRQELDRAGSPEDRAEPFLHVAMDAFLDMLPASHMDHPDGFVFEDHGNAGAPAIAIRTGEVGERTLRGMRHAISALASEGNNLIVDDVMLGAEMEEYRTLLAGFHVSFVGVFASLAIIEERENQRKDRMIGL